MSSEIEKKPPPELDGFDTYEDAVEGEEDRSPSNRVIQGEMLKFTNEATWVRRDGDEMPNGLELVAVDTARIVQKWKDAQPTETIVLEPRQRFPDVEKLNAETPREEWGEGPDGKPRGPWQAQHVVYLVNLETLDRYSFPTGTIGGAIAVRDLVDRVKCAARTSTPWSHCPTCL